MSVEKLRQQALKHQHLQAVVMYAGLSAEDKLRQKLVNVITATELANDESPSMSTSWTADVNEGEMKIRITNSTEQILHDVLMVVDVEVSKELLSSEDAGSMALAGGLSLLMGIDPTEEHNLMLIQRQSGTVNRGGSAFVPEWPAGQAVELSVCGIGPFLGRAQASTPTGYEEHDGEKLIDSSKVTVDSNRMDIITSRPVAEGLRQAHYELRRDP